MRYVLLTYQGIYTNDSVNRLVSPRILSFISVTTCRTNYAPRERLLQPQEESFILSSPKKLDYFLVRPQWTEMFARHCFNVLGYVT